jgi:hypothetical protein
MPRKVIEEPDYGIDNTRDDSRVYCEIDNFITKVNIDPFGLNWSQTLDEGREDRQ